MYRLQLFEADGLVEEREIDTIDAAEFEGMARRLASHTHRNPVEWLVVDEAGKPILRGGF